MRGATLRNLVPAALTLVAAPLSALAAEGLNLSKYDCTRPSDQQTVSGDELANEGFQIANRARFGDANLMMINAKSGALANCFKRQESQK